MATIDRHEVHQFLCMGLAYSAQYGRCGGLLRFLRTLPSNGTQRKVTRWIERFSPYRVECDQEHHPIDLVLEQGRNFDAKGAAATPYWTLPEPEITEH